MENENLIFLPIPVPNFGVFYIKKVLFYYMAPCIFVCENNESEDLFLFTEMETDIWLVAKIDKNEYNSLINKERSVQDIYFSKSSNDIFSIFYDCVNEKYSYSFDITNWLDELLKEADISDSRHRNE